MRETPKYASSKPFFEMSTAEKLNFLGKLLVFFLTMGFAFPRLLSHGAQGQSAKKVETQQDTAALTH